MKDQFENHVKSFREKPSIKISGIVHISCIPERNSMRILRIVVTPDSAALFQSLHSFTKQGLVTADSI